MSTVKSRIKRGTFSGIIISIIIFSALITGVRAEKQPQQGRDKVRVLLFTKHLRLLSEGKINRLHITLQNYAEIDTGIGRIPCSEINLLYKKNAFIVRTGKNTFTRDSLILYPKKTGETFSITINNEKRTYPLPLFIKYSGNELELSIKEDINRFAADSAWGELGNVPEKKSEALYALALLIKARCSIPFLKNKHRGYDFCDLTCCQTYKGRSPVIFDDPVSIDTADITSGLFFHTSSGGTLFSESIFNDKGRISAPPKDLIYSENFILSREQFSSWNAEIEAGELAGILFPGKKVFLKNIIFNMDRETFTVETGNGKNILPPESFRLAVNRVKGWNFLKSNNYSLTRINGKYMFTGSGLGHGVGLSFDGAMQLAEKGYSRYEILEHYYPGLKYKKSVEGINHQLQYIIFNSETGAVIKSNSGVSFKNRIIPCGSLFKLFTALYLAEKRKDLFHNYFYLCTDNENDKQMPRQCWNKAGHGRMNISTAIYNSCNKYFASLYSRIEYDDFSRWITDFTVKHGIALVIPPVKPGKEFSDLLAGLNFNVTITIDGIVKLNRFIYLENRANPSEEYEMIFNALHKTFTDGTAKETDDENSPGKTILIENINRKKLWGKTGTVIAGTNSHHGYGMFTGGFNSTGIVALLRKGTGAMAAGESEKILLNLK